MQLDAVEQVGLQGAQVEHAFTLAYSIWNRTPEQIAAVAQYLKSAGAQVWSSCAVTFSILLNGGDLVGLWLHSRKCTVLEPFQKNYRLIIGCHSSVRVARAQCSYRILARMPRRPYVSLGHTRPGSNSREQKSM